MKLVARRLISSAALASTAVSLISCPGVFGGELEPAFAPAEQSVSAAGNSLVGALSSDHRYVVFISHANNITTNDDLGSSWDVFIRELATGTSTLISVATNGVGGGNDNSVSPAISSEGLLVAFESRAGNLVSGDTNGISDVFLRDLAAGTTRLVSSGINGGPGNGSSGVPLISGDGGRVVFESAASNLVAGDGNGFPDIFAYSLALQTNILVSVGSSGPFASNGPSHSAAISADARFVAFVKGGTNTFPDSIAISHGEVYVRDLDHELITHASSGVHTNFEIGPSRFVCSTPALSQDGRFVAFKAGPTNATWVNLYRHDLQLGLTEKIASNILIQASPQMSADGRMVAFEAVDGVRIWDGVTSSNRLVCANLSGSKFLCSLPTISADGARAAFLVTTNRIASVYVHEWAANSNKLATPTTNGGPARVNESSRPLLSENGALLIFDSSDARLMADDGNGSYDVFAADLNAPAVELVSRRDITRPSVTAFSMSSRTPGSLSASGWMASFLAFDGGLSGTDTNKFADVYVRDLGHDTLYFLGQSTNSTRSPVFDASGHYVAYLDAVKPSPLNFVTGFPDDVTVYRRDLMAGTKILVASQAWGETYVQLNERPIAISSDGNLVAFLSRQSASDIAPGPYSDGNSAADLFVRDISAGTTRLISINSAGNATGNGASTSPMFTPDGRWLLFRSAAANLTTTARPGLFARHLVENRTVLVNPMVEPPRYWPTVSISGDSRWVASIAVGSSQSLEVFDLVANTSRMVTNASSARSASLSGTGRWIAYDKNDPIGGRSIYVTDILNKTNEFISVPYGSTIAYRRSSMPLISYDARFVVFLSDADDLVPNDNNNARDVFVRDRLRGVTLLASINRTGTGAGNGMSTMPILSADGRTVLFQSFASDLIEGDYNETGDVFVLRLGGPDSDGDGLDDEWEMAYFSTLDRDGYGDFDNDGSSDTAEFESGTDPGDTGSVFQVLTVSSGAARRVLWSATPGRRYRVQFKDSLSESNWTAAAETVTPGGTTATWLDASASATDTRFYRVVLIP